MTHSTPDVRGLGTWVLGWMRPDLTGVAFAALFFCLSLTPSLLPRDWLNSGIIGGINAAIGYGIGVLVGALVRRLVLRGWSCAAGRGGRRNPASDARCTWRSWRCRSARAW